MQLLFMTVPIGAVGFFGWLALRFVRARERDVAMRIAPPPSDELVQLREAVFSLQSELHTLRERQDFMEKLLERPRPERGVE